ncbi:MAG: hypothetical protein F9K40_13135 [Kofleriaceae bacterium]|nr:MAG: hypothetical protein F9K40_13135 [Kofleriaceae bacterium]
MASPIAPPPRATSAPARPTGDDFAADARLLFRIGACGSDEPIAAELPRKAIARHCRKMKYRYQRYRRAWVDKAKPFIAALRPAKLPSVAVYPFGGGDLNSALTVFPDATEITTLSLEAAGDIRAIRGLPPKQLAEDLGVVGHDIGRLYSAAYSTTKSLMTASHAKVPGTIMFALAALAVHGHEPLSLRYFDLEPDGSIRYLTGAELDQRAAAAVDGAPEAKQKVGKGTVYRIWKLQRNVFASVEITYRPIGDAGAAPRVYRHVVANLDDEHLAADRRALAHLEQKGKVAVMTKAASFLLWYDDFSQVRSYLTANLAWMISDASGIPPSYATAAGLEQIPYGTFVGAYFIKDPNGVRKAMVKLWAENPARALPFRVGYPDAEDHHHLLITRPRSSGS